MKVKDARRSIYQQCVNWIYDDYQYCNIWYIGSCS